MKITTKKEPKREPVEPDQYDNWLADYDYFHDEEVIRKTTEDVDLDDGAYVF